MSRMPALVIMAKEPAVGRTKTRLCPPFSPESAAEFYRCLMLDTLQLGEIEAIHHGTYRENRWWWHSRGYTPAGVECLNGIRGIDYLVGALAPLEDPRAARCVRAERAFLRELGGDCSMPAFTN